ncbi:MAG: tellurium resistance protein TerC [Terriglobia bacterium]|nr:MAG: tellurium resistance protein TerC [Terriglobia bacterium]
MPAAHFLISGLSIILIDLLLAGDNALVIAMAVRALPREQRRLGIVCGAAGAVLLRIALTAVAARILMFPYIELAGGLMVLWIAVKVLIDAADPPDAAPAPRRFWGVIWFIVLADLMMSIDNILAIAGASGGHMGLIVFGLCLSIPFVIFSSHLLADLMDRFPVLIYLGAAILGKVAGDMILQDPLLANLHLPETARYLVDAILIAVVLVTGRRMGSTRRKEAGDLA